MSAEWFILFYVTECEYKSTESVCQSLNKDKCTKRRDGETESERHPLTLQSTSHKTVQNTDRNTETRVAFGVKRSRGDRSLALSQGTAPYEKSKRAERPQIRNQ